MVKMLSLMFLCYLAGSFIYEILAWQFRISTSLEHAFFMVAGTFVAVICDTKKNIDEMGKK